MLKLIYLIGFLLFCDISKVNSLQCYTCEDCSKIDANTPVETCGATSTSTTTTTSTTTSQSSSTTSPSTAQTTQSTSSSTSSTTSSSSTTSASTQPSSVSTPSTSPSTQSSTVSTTSTTPSTPSTSPSTQSSTILTPSTTPSTPQSSASIPSSSPNPSDPPIESPDENEEINENFRVIRFKRDIMRAESRVDYVCVTLSIKVNNTDHMSRGCVAKPGNDDVCKAILQEAPNMTCTSCSTDKCNSASTFQTSLLLVFIVSVTKYALE